MNDPHHAATARGFDLKANASLAGPNGLPTMGGSGFTDIVTDATPTTGCADAASRRTGRHRP